MAQIRLQISCRSPAYGRNGGQHDPLSPFSLGNVTCLHVSKFTVAPKPLAQPSIWRFHLFWAAGFVQVSSQRPSDISCQARERLLQMCQELRLQVNCRKSSLIPSQDMTYLDMQIQSVRFIANPTATWVGNLLKIIEEFSFIPRPPSRSLASSSGPPFVPYSSGKGWDVMDTMFQIRLRSWWDFRDEFLRIPWDPLYQEDPLWWSWVIQQREGVDLSLPVPDLSFYSDESDVSWGVLVGETLVSEFLVSKPKGILHQPQGDDGSPGWLLRVQLSSQRQEDRSLLRLYHDSRLPQAIGRHEVSYTRRWSRTFFASGQWS